MHVVGFRSHEALQQAGFVSAARQDNESIEEFQQVCAHRKSEPVLADRPERN